jgi:hypothetical protein
MDWVSEEIKTRITPLLNVYGIRLVTFEDFINTQDKQIASLSNTEKYIQDGRGLTCEISLFLKIKDNLLSFSDFNDFLRQLSAIRDNNFAVVRITNIARTRDEKLKISILEVNFEIVYLFY